MESELEQDSQGADGLLSRQVLQSRPQKSQEKQTKRTYEAFQEPSDPRLAVDDTKAHLNSLENRFKDLQICLYSIRQMLGQLSRLLGNVPQ